MTTIFESADKNKISFSAPGFWTPPAKMDGCSVTVLCGSPGGGGGGGTGAGGTGGAGGASSVTDGVQTVQCDSIGPGGTGGAASPTAGGGGNAANPVAPGNYADNLGTLDAFVKMYKRSRGNGSPGGPNLGHAGWIDKDTKAGWEGAPTARGGGGAGAKLEPRLEVKRFVTFTNVPNVGALTITVGAAGAGGAPGAGGGGGGGAGQTGYAIIEWDE